LPNCQIAKLPNCQVAKWFQNFLPKVSIFDELNWKLPKLKVAKIEKCQIESCKNWKLPIESDFRISCQKLTFLARVLAKALKVLFSPFQFVLSNFPLFPHFQFLMK
jgi:hypothetical protein